MNWQQVANTLGRYFLGLGLMLLVPLALSIYYQFFVHPDQHPQPYDTISFLFTASLSFAIGFLLIGFGKKSTGKLFRREGLIAVVLIWLLTPAIGGLPFLISKTLDNPLQAYFEATSGFTTTGASLFFPKKYDSETGEEIPYRRVIRGERDTEYVFYGTINPVRNREGKIIIEGVEAVGKGLLFWRSFIQWLGGLGIIVLFVAILPALGVGGKFLFHAEMPGPLEEALTPRIRETAGMLWKIYLGLTALQLIAMVTTNSKLSWFQSVCITFSTISTGGFGVINGSIGALQNASSEWVVIIFMFLGSVNFSLYYFFLRGKVYRLLEPELIVYLLVLALASCFVSYHLIEFPKVLTDGAVEGVYSLSEAVRTGIFQTISAQTSTGFAVGDYDKWPYVIQVLFLILVYLGGMSGSTAGGIKMMRHIMLFRIAKNKTELMFRPETVRTFRIGVKEVSSKAAITVLCFFLTVVFISALGTFLLTWDGLDPETALTVVTSTINNSGLGFREAGPTDSYAFLSNFGYSLTSLIMILGRLEFFAMLVVLVPAFWRENS